MSTSRPPGRQYGIASVELVLVLPILLALTVLLFAIGAAFRTKFEVLEAARIGAWRHATGTELPVLDAFFGSQTFRGEPIFLDTGPLGGATSERMLERMREAGAREYRRVRPLTAVLDTPTQQGSAATAQSFFTPPFALDNWALIADGSYALVVGPAWEGRTMPIGYDNYLKRTLNSRVLFTTVFPCANGPANSGESSCR